MSALDKDEDLQKTLGNLARDIADLKRFFLAPKTDNRVWNPDNTCHPFHLTTNLNAVPNSEDVLVEFEIPSNQRCVITNYWLHSTDSNNALGGLFVKAALSIHIVRSKYPRPPFVHIIQESGIKLTGNLNKVYESSGVGSDGFGLAVSEFPHNKICRILLDNGIYSIITGGSSAGPHAIQFGMSGYTFPSK